MGKNPSSSCFEGAVPFMAESSKHIDTHIGDGLMVVSSYGGGTQRGEAKMLTLMLKDETSSLIQVVRSLFEICSLP